MPEKRARPESCTPGDEDPMSEPDATRQFRLELLERLRTARDSARIQLHLLSHEAQARFRELEARVELLHARILRGREINTSAAHLKELGEAVDALLHELQGTFELAMPVRQFMQLTPSVCSPDDPLSRAAQIMWELNCGVVPVVASDGRLVGVVTDRDLCLAAHAREQPLAAITVSSTMTLNVCAVSADDTLGHVFYLMSKQRVRRLPVLEGGRLVGVVSIADIALHIQRYSGNSLPACVALAHMLAAVSEPNAGSSTVAA
jgi:CBS domain-containing protein